jgi:prepilin-type N-terminal cleavage/methylation domain-containing protein
MKLAYRAGKNRKDRGFSLVEMLTALTVLAIAALGGIGMIVIGIGRNNNLRSDTTSANVAQTVLEAIASLQATNNATVTILDCAGNAVSINTASGGAAVVTSTPPWPGVGPGDIDFTQAPQAGYQSSYVMCGPNGTQFTYDVRWRIDPVGPPAPSGNYAKLVTVAAQLPTQVKAGAIIFSAPVTLRTVVGN